VSKDLIQQVNEINGCHKGETIFEEVRDWEDGWELSEEEKLEFNKKSVEEVVKSLGKGNFDVGYERTLKILKENSELVDLIAVCLAKTASERS
jgi:hypothetical protein